MKKDLKSKVKKPTLSRNYLEVVAEDIRDKFKIIGEGYKALDEKLDRRFKETDEKLDRQFKETQSNFRTVFNYLSRIDIIR